MQGLNCSFRCVPTLGWPKHPFRRRPPCRSQAGGRGGTSGQQVCSSPCAPHAPGVENLCKGHSSPLLLIPSRCPSHSRDSGGHTWAHRGAAGLLLGGLSWAGRVPGAGAEPGTTAPTRASSHGQAALGAGGPGCPGAPAQQLCRGKGQAFHTGVLAGLGGLGGWVGSEKLWGPGKDSWRRGVSLWAPLGPPARGQVSLAKHSLLLSQAPAQATSVCGHSCTSCPLPTHTSSPRSRLPESSEHPSFTQLQCWEPKTPQTPVSRTTCSAGPFFHPLLQEPGPDPRTHDRALTPLLTLPRSRLLCSVCLTRSAGGDPGKESGLLRLVSVF